MGGGGKKSQKIGDVFYERLQMAFFKKNANQSLWQNIF